MCWRKTTGNEERCVRKLLFFLLGDDDDADDEKYDYICEMRERESERERE